LYPSEDLRDLWKDAWSIQKKIPILEGYNYVSIEIYAFLEDECPLGRPAKSKDPKDINVFLKMYI
jgi:WASH complex subunit 7